MEKTRKLMSVVFLMALLLGISLIQADIDSTKSVFKTTESVTVKSSSALCINLGSDEEVELYIVDDLDWVDGDTLEDVRGEPSLVSNSKFTFKKVWNTPEVGDYDIIVDCVNNGVYDTLEPIDSLDDVGFTVEAVAGSGSVKIGSNDIQDHSWEYDPEQENIINEVLQISLSAKGEDILLENITLSSLGSGDDTLINILEVYIDENGNGLVDEDEGIIGDVQPGYDDDDGETTLILDYILTHNVTENILIAYSMQKIIEDGEFSVTVESLYGTGESSEKMIKFSGTPIDSGITTAKPAKKCLGTLDFEIIPNPVEEGLDATAKISNLTGCEGWEVSIKSNPCSNTQSPVSTCTVTGEGCDAKIDSPSGGRYYACLDKNEDEDFADFKESQFSDLTILAKEEVIEEETEEGNETEEEGTETEEEGTETGEETTKEEAISDSAMEGVMKEISEAGGFLVLLEITLLLILFVLVMILFRLRGVVRFASPESEEEKEDEDEEEEETKKKK